MTGQLVRFGLIGAGAMMVHWLVVVAIVPLGLVPLLANVVGFLVAFQVSYLGHRHWTFGAHDMPHRQTLPRFFAVACTSFAANELMYFLLLRYTSLDYRLSLAIVLFTVAVFTFVLSRQWAFRKAGNH